MSETPAHMASIVQKNLQAMKKIYPWISTPLIVSAPMRVFAGPSLAAAVSRAGGIGFMGPGAKPTDLSDALTEVGRIMGTFEPAIPRMTLSRSGSQSQDFLPVGIGFQTFDADLKVAAGLIREHRPAAVWLFAPRHGQEEFDVWSERIRAVSPGIQIWIQVGSVRDAVNAARSEQRPDVLVLQGLDAGGHGLARGAGIISLLPEVDDALREITLQYSIPLIAAGGIVDGRGVAAALSMGAVGAAMGTRFLASREANVPQGYLQDVLRTTDGGQNTIRTTLYDQLAGRVDWPSGYDGRNIVNDSIIDQDAGMEFAENKKRYMNAAALGDEGWGSKGRLTAYVGSAVGLVKEVTPAGEIVREARDSCRRASYQVSESNKF